MIKLEIERKIINIFDLERFAINWPVIKVNKRYADLFNQYIHRGESTPFTLGTILVCVLCFILLIVATFTQFNVSHPWFNYVQGQGLSYGVKTITYNPQFPVIIFITYILYKSYSTLVYLVYLLVGFFVYPIFAFGGGLDYIQNYFFGYILGFIFAILIAGKILKEKRTLKGRFLASLAGISSIHITGFIYCIFLAMFNIIDYNLIGPIVEVVTLSRIIYDIIFSFLLLLIAPCVKNVLWVCMRPLFSRKKKSKNSNKRSKVVSDDLNKHRQNYN